MAHASRVYLALPLLALLVASPAAADEPLLPSRLGSSEQVAWEQADAPELERLAGPLAPLLREYGARRAEQALYLQAATRSRVTVCEMVDHSAAYGAFTVLRAAGEPVSLGEAGARLDNRLLFFQGNYFVTIEDSTQAARWQPLAAHLEERTGNQASLPNLPLFLPSEGLVPASDRYLLGPLALQRVAPFAPGDWAGFAYGAEAEAARYRTGAGNATLMLLSYPTPQIASERLEDFERLFNLNGTGDPRRSLAFAKRKGSLVIFVAGIDSGWAAAALIDQVRYEMTVSWSEPSPGRPELNWPHTVVNIFTGAGLFLLFALGSGLLFGAVRLIVKRLWPDKVFDRRSDTEIIQLKLDRRP
ncbi:hypothetical protein MYX77_10325 [Acidobacteriia bacterium AH_259_A11_L15]|nr:hypothetical protein [Acidobacteriia bacterium AH_259_A11_L15]